MPGSRICPCFDRNGTTVKRAAILYLLPGGTGRKGTLMARRSARSSQAEHFPPPPTPDTIRRLCPYFEEVPDNAIGRIVARGTTKSYPVGHHFTFTGDRVSELHLILSGVILTVSAAEDGREHVIALIQPGTFSGLFGVIGGQPCPHDHMAYGDTTTLTFPAREVHALIDDEPDFRRAVLRQLSDRLRETVVMLDEYAIASPLRRLAHRLLTLTDAYGRPAEKGLELDIQLNQSSMGAMVGLSRQSTNKLLRALEGYGVLRFRYGQIVILDRNRLRDISAGKLNLD